MAKRSLGRLWLARVPVRKCSKGDSRRAAHCRQGLEPAFCGDAFPGSHASDFLEADFSANAVARHDRNSRNGDEPVLFDTGADEFRTQNPQKSLKLVDQNTAEVVAQELSC